MTGRNYQQLKREGLCVQCREPSRPGKVMCFECAAKHAKRGSETQRKMRAEYKCLTCGGQSRGAYCSQCRAMHNQRSQATKLERALGSTS